MGASHTGDNKEVRSRVDVNVKNLASRGLVTSADQSLVTSLRFHKDDALWFI
jgi:hypothetical protein